MPTMLPMRPKTRYQGAIVQDGAILLIQQREHANGRTYWLLPGGGMEAGESPEATVIREMREETGLDVHVERLVLDLPSTPGGYYERAHTYLCTPIGGAAAPGYEPEEDVADQYSIVGVRWFRLADDSQWGDDVHQDRITARNLRLLQEALGYSVRAGG